LLAVAPIVTARLAPALPANANALRNVIAVATAPNSLKERNLEIRD